VVLTRGPDVPEIVIVYVPTPDAPVVMAMVVGQVPELGLQDVGLKLAVGPAGLEE